MNAHSFRGDSPEALVLAEGEEILIVVPTLNERGRIEPLLTQLLADVAGLHVLIVVADGGSTDGTANVVAAMARSDARIALVHNPKRVQSAGVNLAVRNFGSGRKWLIRMDAHAEYPKGYIRTLVAEAKRMRAEEVVVSMASAGAGFFQRAVATAQNSILGTGNSAHRRKGKAEFVDHGHHALFRLDVFVKLGGYDETMSHNEDAEIDTRLTKAGGRIWLTRAVAVTYIPRSHPGSLYRQYFNYGRGRARTLKKHGLRPKLRQLLPVGVAPACVMLSLLPVHLAFAAPAILWAGGCLCMGAALGLLRQKDPPAYFSGVAAMIMHLGWSIGFWREIASGSNFRHDGPLNLRTATEGTASNG